MKEIKFRAWHNEFGQMVYASNYDGGAYEKREFMPWVFKVGFSNYPEGEWELMQYTGLKDKNGTEIYEGDVLRSCQTNMTVGFALSRGWVAGENNIYENLWNIHRGCEVIGNIHENPGLELSVK